MFQAYVERARSSKKWIDGPWKEEDSQAAQTAQLNREIIVRSRFPTYVPDPFAGLEDG